MKFYDIFNGDADGLCALRQLRLAGPRDSVLVTGPKRDIRLLDRIEAGPADILTVLDISMARNAEGLQRALASGASVTWFDHHHPGEVPRHERLEAHIDTDPSVCTSLLVDRHLEGRARAWAIVGAFGDNLGKPAQALASACGYTGERTALLQRLGRCLNYNAYGDTESDLLFPPRTLYERLGCYADPEVFALEDDAFPALEEAMTADLEKALAVRPMLESETAAVFELPDDAWSRRVTGTFANHVTRSNPGRAHAILTPSDGGITVSIRAPADHPAGADELARRFDGGGGRAAAAGIDHLPTGRVPEFVEAFLAAYTR